MNSVELIGRLVRDPDIRYTSGTNNAVATFNLAVDRDGQRDDNGNKITDFPRVTAFGKTAETCEKYLKKGRLIAIQGRLQTGSYTNRKGDTVYTTDVVANRVELIDWDDKRKKEPEPKPEERPEPKHERQQSFMEINDDDVPF